MASLSEGDRFEFRDFGVFEVVERKAKIGRNPKSPATSIPIPARRAVKFSPGRKMKQTVANKKCFPDSSTPVNGNEFCFFRFKKVF